eukprot:jgi/Orpsp1_1/1192598/evm.model.d7180000094524.1
MTDKSGQELIEYEHENMKNYNYNNENFLIIQIFKMNNDAVIKSYLNHVNTHNISWNINIKDETNTYPLLYLIKNNNVECLKLLLEYVNSYNLTLNILDKNNDGNYPLLESVKYDGEGLKLLLEYAKIHNIILNITDKNNVGNYPLLSAANGNSENVKLLMDYARTHNIILNITDKNNDGNYPLLSAANSNSENVKLLIDYAKTHNIILNITDKNNEGQYPISVATKCYNIVTNMLLIEYANDHNITLNLDNKDIDVNSMFVNHYFSSMHIQKFNIENKKAFLSSVRSNIIKKDEINLILEWIEMKPKNFKLLLDSKINGDLTDTFYDACKDKKPTIVFIQSTDGYRFGGFTNETWPMKDFKEDSKSFIFSLDKKRKYKIINGNKAIYLVKRYGFSFGENSIFIYNKSSNTDENITTNMKSHDFPENVNDLNGGKKNFKVLCYEVYQIII